MHPLFGRLIQAVITLWAAITIGFVLIHQLPTGPWEILQAMYTREELMNMDPHVLREISEGLMGFRANAPLWEQYIQYVQNILQLEFGTSIIFGEPVFQVLAPVVPWTMFMSSLAMVANVSMGLTFGAYMAYREGSRFDVGATILNLVLGSIPYYVLAIFLLIFLGYGTTIFPSGGRYTPGVTVGFNLDFMLSALHHVALPFISLTFTGFAALGLRAHSIRILGSDYIRVARLRGLSEQRIVFHYVMRNSILPMYTGLVTGLVGLLGGSVITEMIFKYRGMGLYTFIAAAGGDIPMVLGTFAFFTFVSVLSLLVVDMTYHWIDPRAEGVGASESR